MKRTRIRALSDFEPETGVRLLTSGLVSRIKGQKNRFIRPKPVSNRLYSPLYAEILITKISQTKKK